LEFGKNVVIVFIDLDQAYHSWREKFCSSLRRLKVLEYLTGKVKLTHNDCTGSVKTELGRSEWFETGSEVRKGSILLPVLFNNMMDEVVNKVRAENIRADMKTLIFAENVLIGGRQKGPDSMDPYKGIITE
jgi:hypothetical protein